VTRAIKILSKPEYSVRDYSLIFPLSIPRKDTIVLRSGPISCYRVRCLNRKYGYVPSGLHQV